MCRSQSNRGEVTLAISTAVAGRLKRLMQLISSLYFNSPPLASLSYISQLAKCCIGLAQTRMVVAMPITKLYLGSPNIDQVAFYIHHANPLTYKKLTHVNYRKTATTACHAGAVNAWTPCVNTVLSCIHPSKLWLFAVVVGKVLGLRRPCIILLNAFTASKRQCT